MHSITLSYLLTARIEYGTALKAVCIDSNHTLSIKMERKKIHGSFNKLKVSACPEVSVSIPENLICVSVSQ